MTRSSDSAVYDAAPILGLGKASDEPLPDPDPGEVVIRVGAWSLRDLRTCETVVRDSLVWDSTWYDQYAWSQAKLTPSVYRVRIPVPYSSGKTFAQQHALLLPGEQVTPVALAAAVLLCHLKVTGTDLLDYEWIRCAEALPDEYRVGLNVDEGRVNVNSRWDDVRREDVWLAGCRKL